MLKSPNYSLLLAAATMTACAQPNVTYNPTVRVAGVLFDSYEAKVSAGGTSVSGDTDLSSWEIGLGATTIEDGERTSLAEVIIAKSTYGNLDALEISGGGRYYFTAADSMSTFASFYWVNTLFDDVAGVSVGVQGGLRLGFGGEYRLSEQVFIDSSVNYLVPLIPAESSIGGVETEVGGLGIQLGVGFEF